MFLSNLKTALTLAVTNTFDDEYPVPQFQGLFASVEYPNERINYPGVWVDFEPTAALERGGVDQQLYVPVGNGGVQPVVVWRFQGMATYTLVSLSSLERDLLFDEFVRVIGFANGQPQISVFRQSIDNNPYIATNFDFDSIQMQGKSEVPGTPWGTEEVLYEITVAVQCIGEFYADVSQTILVPLAEISIAPTISGGPTEPATLWPPA